MKNNLFIFTTCLILLGQVSCVSVSKETDAQLLKELLQKSFIAPRLNENESYIGKGYVLLRDKDGNAVHIDNNGNVVKILKDSVEVHKYISQLNHPEELYPTLKDNKWGFIDSEDNLVIPHTYNDVISFVGQNFHWVKKESRWGGIDNQGSEIIPFEYHKPRKLGDSFFVIENQRGKGVVSSSGKIIVPCFYVNVEKAEGYGGYIKVRSEVGNGWKYGLYDYSGNMLFDCEYDEISSGTQGMFVWIRTEKDGNCQYHYGVQDRWGDVELTSSGIYTRGEDFKEGYARVFRGEQYGFLSLFEQREVIPCIYNHSFEYYGHGVFVLWDDDTFAIVDENRNLLTPYKYKDAYVSEDYISVKDAKTSKWGLLSHKGNEIIPPLYDRSFTIKPNSIGVVCKNGKEGCIDKKNNERIPFEFDKIVIHPNGYIEANQNNSIKIYNGEGELIQYSDMQIINFYGLYITCLTNDSEMMVNVKRKYDLNDAFPNVIIKTSDKEDVKKHLVELCSQIAKYLLGGNADIDLSQMILGEDKVNLFLYNENAFNF